MSNLEDINSNNKNYITTEWNGSHISIYDVDGIIQDATEHRTILYDRSDFPFPIERIKVYAEIVQPEKEDALMLESILQLDRTYCIDSNWLVDRFQKYFTPQDVDSDDYQKRPPFHIRNLAFSDTFLVSDDESGSKFVLWLNQEENKIQLTNDIRLTAGNEVSEIYPPVLASVSPEKLLKSQISATALLADFVNGFYKVKDQNDINIMNGVPLNREYIIGNDRRPDVKSKVIKKLGDMGIQKKISNDRNSSPVFDIEELEPSEKQSVEKLNPENMISLNDIGGLESVKKILSDVAISFKHHEIMKKWGTERPRGVLLYGEPGTGKTMLVKALSNEIGAELMIIQSTDIYGAMLGNSEQHIKDIFSKLKGQNDTPIVLFFDEFESIFGITNKPSAGGADSARNAVAGIFKQEMNTLAQENPNVLVVAATNDLDCIDPSLIRSGRFDHKIYVPMPDQTARIQIIANIMSEKIIECEDGNFKLFDDSLSIEKIASQTDDLSGADIAEIFRRLSLSRAMEEVRTGKEQTPISQLNFEQEIRNFRQNG